MIRYLFFSAKKFNQFLSKGHPRPYLYYMNDKNEIVQVTESRLFKDKLEYSDEKYVGLMKRFIIASDKDIHNLLQIAQKKV